MVEGKCLGTLTTLSFSQDGAFLLVTQHRATRNGILSGVLGTPAFRRAEREAVDRAFYWLGQMGLTEDANPLAGELRSVRPVQTT